MKNYIDVMTLNDKDLANEMLIAYAWKKSYSYITTTNWYADNFELDLSSINLEKTVLKIKNKIDENYSFEPMHLVAVPKSCRWEFREENNKIKWLPRLNDDQKLRPLAHISINDQAIMTLVMMGLANQVETLQGNPETLFKDVHEKKMVSYGNRLYCNYINDEAFYNYGSTNTYSKFFLDYQNFLKRPQYFSKKYIGKIAPDEEICIIELDIEKFFDKVNRVLLADKILEFLPENNNKINRILSKFISWEWSFESILEFSFKFEGEKLPQGIPQGLVAAGFLSNIYLLDFDKEISKKIGSNINNSNIFLIDYCRYVDDMRLVIKKNKDVDNFVVLKEVLEYFDGYLSKLSLNLNNNKSKIDTFRGASGNISKKLNSLNKKLSGPIPFEDIEDQLGHLEALLNLTRVGEQEKNNVVPKKNWLQQIDKHYFDLREDTVKRFSANKICRVLSEIRHFTSQEVDEKGKVLPGNWDFVQERIARRFISLWCEDPSQTLLLKKGIELFPSPQLINPIINELKRLLENENHTLKCVSKYCSSEILRHVSTVIHTKDKLAFPAHSEIETFFEILQSFAAEIIINKDELDDFCFLRKQAEFLLLVRSDSTLEVKGSNSICDFIFKITNGFRNISYKDLDESDVASAILFSNNLSIDKLKFYRGVTAFFEKLYNSNENREKLFFENIFNIIVFQNIHLAKEIYYYSIDFNFKFVRSNIIDEIVEKYNFKIVPLSGDLSEIKGKQSILKIIKRDDNPFSNEIMILRLLKSVLESDNLKRNIAKNLFFDFKRTQVEFNFYSNPPKYSALDINCNFDIYIRFKEGKVGFIYQNVDSDLITLHKIATFVRSCIIGEEDWTLNKNLLLNNKLYSGIKSSYTGRQLGVLTTPEILLGEGAQLSNWLTDLLSRMLQLNYFVKSSKNYDWPDKLNLESVYQLVIQRIEYLKTYYCQLSETPALIEQVKLDWPKDKKNLSVAMVQSKMPRSSDLNKYGLYLDNPAYRPQHRKHLTRVCKLIIEQIKAQKVYEPFEKEEPRDNNIDILVWPELAVHKDDLDVLVNLSRKIKSIIYAGLCYLDQPGVEGPNNCAIWIVPSKHGSNKVEIKRLQGKKNMMALESSIKSWRPYQFFLELIHPRFPNEKGFMITGSICYDATDIALSADLRDKSNAYFVSALNKDINTFDTMIEALHYHMYQHVVLVNSGEFGGSYAKAPYRDHYCRLISHVHGNDQVSISTFEMNMFDFRRDKVGDISMTSGKSIKSSPAGITYK